MKEIRLGDIVIYQGTDRTGFVDMEYPAIVTRVLAGPGKLHLTVFGMGGSHTHASVSEGTVVGTWRRKED